MKLESKLERKTTEAETKTKHGNAIETEIATRIARETNMVKQTRIFEKNRSQQTHTESMMRLSGVQTPTTKM